MTKVPNGIETLPRISTGYMSRAHERCRQTDGRATAYSEREREWITTVIYSEREFTFVKNECSNPFSTVTYKWQFVVLCNSHDHTQLSVAPAYMLSYTKALSCVMELLQLMYSASYINVLASAHAIILHCKGCLID